jgi:beta-ribofuranosylaminobenzene 5'-phosphate synthase
MKVFIKTPARLHLGLIDLGGELGRLYGGIGVAINYPNVVLEAEKAQSLTIEGTNSESLRPSVQLLVEKLNINPKVAINIKQVIPQHVGLGSGTQLALAAATALARIFNINASTEDLAKAMTRGTISGIGTAVFKKGGFVIESGVKTKKNKPDPDACFPPMIFQEPLPEDWMFVVAIPNAKQGLSGKEEGNAFRSLPSAPSEKAARISHLMVMSLLPALKERDVKTFGLALTRIQSVVGDCFASVQGGRFSTSQSSECIEYMLSRGALGAGQSSWGPTVYGLVEGKEEAKELCAAVRDFLLERAGGQVFYTATNNRGAYVRTTRGIPDGEA